MEQKKEVEEQPIHYRIVEQGKIYSLENNYAEALRHYREGIRMCQGEPNADFFFQHYSQCLMETLELSGAHDEVISLCEKTRDFIRDRTEESEYIKRLYASLTEKQAIQCLLKDEKEDALELFKEVQKMMGLKVHPITNTLINWVQRRYAVTEKQIRDTQNANQYFSVRKENVNPKIAIILPAVAMPI